MRVCKTGNFGLFQLFVIALCSVVVTACRSDSNIDAPSRFVANVPQTGQLISHRPGDDGDWQAGVAWPNPRFVNNADGTVTDNLTGLIWLKNLSCFSERVSWGVALDAANALSDNGAGDCGLSDASQAGSWRLPNVRELLSLSGYDSEPATANSPDPFYGVQGYGYWSSTTLANDPDWALLIDGSFVRQQSKTEEYHLRPVRDGNTGVMADEGPKSGASVPKTGQFVSYHTGDDGDWQAGVAWPNPRFTDNANGTATDELTGLIWLRDTNCIEPSLWDDAIDAVHELADDGAGGCGLSDGSQAGDWRLPNVLELLSLVDYSQSQHALAEGHFFLQESSGQWSATNHGEQAMRVGSGRIFEGDKFDERGAVWPVRAGQI